jgi:hypothetical protein
MSKFAELCSEAVARATGDELYIGAVCRLNHDDALIVSTRNDEYGKHPSLPVCTSAKLSPKRDPIERLQPVSELLTREYEPLAVTPQQHEVTYWNNMLTAVRTGQSSYAQEGLSIYRREYVPAGLVGEEWMRRAEAKARAEAEGRMAAKLKDAQEAEKRHAHLAHSARRSMLDAVDRAYQAMHGNKEPYPREYVHKVPGQSGGHAEENLIRIWASITQGLELRHVDLFISRMPCPTNSSGFTLGPTVYKEGCINKLIQLVASTDGGVTWDISYYQRLSGMQQALTTTYAQGFPSRARFYMWTAPTWRAELASSSNAPW